MMNECIRGKNNWQRHLSQLHAKLLKLQTCNRLTKEKYICLLEY